MIVEKLDLVGNVYLKPWVGFHLGVDRLGVGVVQKELQDASLIRLPRLVFAPLLARLF